MNRSVFFIIVIFLFSGYLHAQGIEMEAIDLSKKGDIHVISIGINSYPEYPLRLCVSDSESIVQKIIYDNENGINKDPSMEESPFSTNVLGKKVLLDTGRLRNYPIQNIHIHKLNDSDATLTNIRNAFKEVINQSKVNDYFIFFFSGFSSEFDSGQTFLIPYMTELNYQNIDENKMFSLVEMAKLMEQIPAEKQLIISEAGNGRSFAENLIIELFESNPLIAAGTKRNRVILTTKNLGIEGGSCPDGTRLNTGYLTHYILKSHNLLDAFYYIDKYEYDLVKAEVECAWNNSKYVSIFQEKQFRDILIKNFKNSNSRGSNAIEIPKKENENENSVGETHGIIIATNTYDHNSDWSNLKNPINDANAVADVLNDRYKFNIHKLYNQTREELLLEIIKIKGQLKPNDKLLFFVAGHGYYSSDYSDGYIVLKDSKPLTEDITMNSYLQMATLNRLLDNMPSKNIFAVFDVCFGASFDLNAKDVGLSNYKDLERDISIDQFIERKSKNKSRLFLASGRYEVPDYWDSSLDHSPFADKLIKVLRKEKNFISPGKIFSSMEANATEPILKQFGRHEERGDFLLGVKE